MILDSYSWQSRIWRFHTDVELAGFYSLLGGQLRLLLLEFPKQPLLLGGQFVRFALLSRFVSFDSTERLSHLLSIYTQYFL